MMLSHLFLLFRFVLVGYLRVVRTVFLLGIIYILSNISRPMKETCYSDKIGSILVNDEQNKLSDLTTPSLFSSPFIDILFTSPDVFFFFMFSFQSILSHMYFCRNI